MKGEIDHHKDMVRGAKAEALLNDDLFKETLAVLEQEYTKAFKTSTAGEWSKREQAWALLYNLERFKAHLVKVINDGKMAKSHLVEIAGRKAAA